VENSREKVVEYNGHLHWIVADSKYPPLHIKRLLIALSETAAEEIVVEFKGNSLFEKEKNSLYEGMQVAKRVFEDDIGCKTFETDRFNPYQEWNTIGTSVTLRIEVRELSSLDKIQRFCYVALEWNEKDILPGKCIGLLRGHIFDGSFDQCRMEADQPGNGVGSYTRKRK